MSQQAADLQAGKLSGPGGRTAKVREAILAAVEDLTREDGQEFSVRN